nr:VanZ family protein [Saccharopolyspora gloriosae]
MRWWALSFYAFLYYLITAYCLVLMPLPSPSLDVCAEYPRMRAWQLMPGNTFRDVWKEAEHRVTFGDLVLHNSAVIETGFNLLLLLPLGVFLRYHFRRGPLVSLAIAAGVALSFEVTQGTGVFGLYECPYRLFDVDDLVVNVAGAMLGWVIGGPVSRALPQLTTLDGRVLARHPVPFGRRVVALLVDFGATVVLSGFGLLAALVLDLPLWLPPFAVLGAWFVVLPALTGATPGKRLLLLELVDAEGRRPAVWRLLVRAVVLAVPFLPPLVPVLLVAERGALADLVRFARAGEIDTDVLLVVALGVAIEFVSLFLVLTYALVVRFHPRDRSVHDLVSGVSNRALPHHNADRRTAEDRESVLTG